MMRGRHIARYALFAALAAVLWVLWPLQKKYRNLDSVQQSSDSALHPIERLYKEAKSKQALILRQQSQNLEEARSEYRRRYEIPPPEGFDAWYDYAKKQKTPIIDDFDDLMASVRPFRGYQKAECEFQHMQNDHPALMTVCVKNGSVDVGKQSAYDTKQIANPLIDMVSDFVDHLPDMCFYLNTFDEPRQVIPLDKQAGMIKHDTITTCEDHAFRTVKRKNVWDQVIKSCPKDSAARLRIQGSSQSHNEPVQDWKSTTDLCSYADAPSSGILRCPDTSSLTSGARPILSAATLSTFSDIIFPTLWRWRFNIDNPKSISWASLNDTTAWASKRSTLGWRGSSTGGHASGTDFDANWRRFQRHQMVALAHNPQNPQPPLHIRRPALLQSRLDVRFTKIEGCDDTACQQMKTELPPAPPQPLADTFASKIVLDMDGHGLSGRFYMLLQSRSAVMKQGLIREWHDSRLRPWLHYIPLSMGMAELEDLLDFFLATPDGDRVLEAIAEEGKDWVRRALRREDMRVYMYRLLLELGRRTF